MYRAPGVKDSRGAVVVLVALAMTALLGLAALVADFGLLASFRVHLANACDAAALAGAQELPGRPEEAEAIARAYAAANGVAPEEVEAEVSPDCRELTVRARREMSLFFARALGFARARVAAAAMARVAPLAAVRGAVPFAVEDQQLVVGKPYVLKEGSGSPEEFRDVISGWYGALDLDGLRGGGARDYEERVKFGYEGVVRVGDVLPVEPGNMSRPTTRGVAYRLSQCRDGCTWDNFRRGCPRLVLVPVVRPEPGKGEKMVRVVGFAAFFLEEVGGTGEDSYVRGRFVQYVGPGEAGEAGEYGAFGVKLVR